MTSIINFGINKNKLNKINTFFRLQLLSNRQPVNNISDASADPLAIPQVNEVVGNNTRGSLSTVIFIQIK